MICCVFSLESPRQGDSNEYTQYTIFSIKKKTTLNYSKSPAMNFFQRIQEQVRNSRGKLAITVRATEVLLYVNCLSLRAICNGPFCTLFY